MARESVVFTTEEGVEVKLVAVRQVVLDLAAAKIVDEFRKRGEPIDIPTYEVDAFGGEKMRLNHEAPSLEIKDELGNILQAATPGTLDVPGNPQETGLRRALWKRYEDAVTKLQVAQMEERYKALIFFGIHVDIPSDDQWLESQRIFGLPDPKDAVERKVRYVSTELCSQQDLVAIMSMLQMMIGGKAVSGEQVKAYEALFRRALEGAATSRVDLALASLRRMVGPSEVDGIIDSNGVGNNETESLG